MEANEPRRDSSSPPYQRWYDKQQTVSKSVRLLETFPMEYQEVLGDTMIRLAEKHCQVGELLENLRKLGPEKVLSLFKAKSKGRGYDQNETVHKAMNYLYVLPEKERIFIATQVIEVVGYLFEYFSICRETGQPTSRDVVQGLSTAFVRGQLKDTVEHLARFYPSMILPNGPTLRAIRARIAQNKNRAYQEEIAAFRARATDKGTTSNAFTQAAGTASKNTLSPIMETFLEQASVKSPKEDAPESFKSAADTPPTFEPMPKEDRPKREKDETVAQDNRGMKIKLDKFGL